MASDELIERLDLFAERLLEDAEREPVKGKPAASLAEKVGVFRAVTAYLDKRGARQAVDKATKDDGPAENEPTILRLQRQVKRAGRRA